MIFFLLLILIPTFSWADDTVKQTPMTKDTIFLGNMEPLITAIKGITIVSNPLAASFNANGFAINNSSSITTAAGNQIFYSTSTNAAVAPNNTRLSGYGICVGSVTALGTGGTQVVTPSGFTNIYFPMVTEVATDAEANQMNISAITATSFTIKNKSALNAKDAIWACFCK